MSHTIAWEDIRPGMVVYVERFPELGAYPPAWSAAYRKESYPLEPHYIREITEDGSILFDLDFWDCVAHGHLAHDSPRVRYWTDGEPTWDQRCRTPWEV